MGHRKMEFRICKLDQTAIRPKILTGGMGLSNIRDRAKALGGTVQITQENGFRIFVTVPKSVSN